MGFELFFSAGKRANNEGLSGVMLDMSVEFVKGGGSRNFCYCSDCGFGCR